MTSTAPASSGEADTADVFDWQDVLDRGAFVHNQSLAAEVAHARVLPGTFSLAQGELAADLRPTAAIQDLQRQAGLPQTGKMNAATQAALANYLAHGNNQMGGNS